MKFLVVFKEATLAILESSKQFGKNSIVCLILVIILSSWPSIFNSRVDSLVIKPGLILVNFSCMSSKFTFMDFFLFIPGGRSFGTVPKNCLMLNNLNSCLAYLLKCMINLGLVVPLFRNYYRTLTKHIHGSPQVVKSI